MLKRRSIPASFCSPFKVLFWSCALAFWMVLMVASPATAQDAVTWDDLQSHPTHLKNPYEQLTAEQTYRLSSLYQLKEWVKDNPSEVDNYEIEEIERLEQAFQDDGLDTDKLLVHVDKARDYWRSQRKVTNPDLDDRDVQLSGYVLPLQENQQKLKQVNEFLLVPYVGACIHVPPPPPNQIIYIKPETAIENPGVFSSVQISGTLHAKPSSHEIFQVDGSRVVEVGYAMDMNAIAPAPRSAAPKISGPWWRTIPARVSNALTISLGNLSRHTSPQTFALAILLSFSYGVLHTLGPGHGKAVIVSYFIGHNGSLRRGLVMGIRIAVFHVLSAVVVAILTDTILQQVGGAENYRIIRLISYGAIAIIGGRMLAQALQQHSRTQANSPELKPVELPRSSVNPLTTSQTDSLLYPSISQQINESNSRTPDCNCLTCDERRGVGGWLALAVGSVPCSGALLVLLYGLANNLLWPSIMMVISISVGMACTLGWIGVMAMLGNRYSQKIAVRRQRKSSWTKRQPTSRFSLAFSGQIIGASCVSILGVGLFFLTLLTGPS